MSQELPFYRRPITRKTVLLVVFTPLSVAAVSGLLWLAWAARPLNVVREFGVTTPQQTPPVSNAAGLYDAAYKKFTELKDSRKPVDRILDRKAPASKDNDDKLYPLSGKIQWLEDNKEAFFLLDKATAATYAPSSAQDAKPAGDELSKFGNYRELARYNAVRCEVLAAQGKHAQAVDKAIEFWQLGMEMQNNANYVTTLVGIAIEAVSRSPLDNNIAHLTAIEAARAAKRMEVLTAKRPPLQAILHEEYTGFLLTIVPRIVEQTRQTQRDAAYERGEYDYVPEDNPTLKLFAPLINWSARKMAHEYHDAMQPLLATAQAPWSQRHYEIPINTASHQRDLVETLAKGRFHFTRGDVGLQLSMTRLALHAYRKTYDVYPSHLKDLVPAYLKKVPSDAFADGKPLHYRREGNHYKLWSVGPDGRNDNARPAQNPNKQQQAKYLITIDLSGDIVAGVNRY